MKKILLIEDNAFLRRTTADILELSGYQVVQACDGKEGVDMANSELPDMIVCDVEMPELDGYGVLHYLSSNPRTARIPFIFLTSRDGAGEVRRGMSSGADDYLVKPFSEQDLLATIKVRLRKSAITQREYGQAPTRLKEFIEDASQQTGIPGIELGDKPKSYDAKRMVYTEGDQALYVYYVISGIVKVLRTDSYGKELIVELVKSGEFFGYNEVLGGDEYGATAEVLEEAEIHAIPRQVFLDLMHRNRDVSMRFVRMLAGEVEQNQERLLALAYASVRERTAIALLELHERFADNPGSPEMSREDLAGVVGTAKESLIRALSDFKSDGWVELDGRAVRILDESALRQFAGK
ncbi:MAG: response regulator [Flavobacteriales bacterium]|nr:response regulator [Flavobacteriales bacterium]